MKSSAPLMIPNIIPKCDYLMFVSFSINMPDWELCSFFLTFFSCAKCL